MTQLRVIFDKLTCTLTRVKKITEPAHVPSALDNHAPYSEIVIHGGFGYHQLVRSKNETPVPTHPKGLCPSAVSALAPPAGIQVDRPISHWFGASCVRVWLPKSLGERSPVDALGHSRSSSIFCSLLRGVVAMAYEASFFAAETLQEPYEVEISEDTLSASSSHGQTTMAWEDFHKYKTSNRIILLYQSDALFHMFPIRWFSGDQFTKFREILRAKLGEPKP